MNVVAPFNPQVTWIPVKGPAPYNTLICVQSWSTAGGMVLPNNGDTVRMTTRITTPFKLPGFDPRVTPVCQHSTTAVLSVVGPAKDNNFIYSVDAVAGAGFSAFDGSWYVDVDTAGACSDVLPETCFGFGQQAACIIFSLIQVTSFVLCVEPPLPTVQQLVPLPQAGRRGAQRIPFSPRELLVRNLGVAVAGAAQDSPVKVGPDCRC